MTSAVASICAKVDGIPLAIELAATRLRTSTVKDIDGRLDDRLRLLGDERLSTAPRQRTLSALIQWSVDLLTPSERVAFCRLSVFSGGWQVDQAERALGFEPLDRREVFELLASLVDKSLVEVDRTRGAAR